MQRLFKFTALAATCVLGFANVASAQITWQPSVNMFQDLPTVAEEEAFLIDTTGVGLVAYNATADITSPEINPVVNGVMFTSTLTDTPLVGVGGHSITLNGGTNNTGAFGDGEFRGNIPLFNLIRGGTFAVESVTLDGLVPGTDYLVQVFTNDARATRNMYFQTRFGDGSGSTSPVAISDLNNSPPGTMMVPDPDDPTGVAMISVLIPATFPKTEAGDIIIGTFTATGSSLTFNLFGSNVAPVDDPATFNAGSTGDGRAQINGIQLRDVSGGVMPPFLKGDVDLSGIVDFGDIAPFIGVLQGGMFQQEADCDCSTVVDFGDIVPFIAILQGQ